MNDTPSLAPGLYLAPTPPGRCTWSPRSTTARPPRWSGRSCDRRSRSRPITSTSSELTGVGDLGRRRWPWWPLAQDAGWIEGRTDGRRPPSRARSAWTCPDLLAPLSDVGQAALVDDQGFALSSVGFTPEAEAELSILAAEVVRLQQRRTTFAAASATARSRAGGWWTTTAPPR